ncbi:trypsin-like peptidase domain-containing protein [Candidatus Riflebacteria bacterium]
MKQDSWKRILLFFSIFTLSLVGIGNAAELFGTDLISNIAASSSDSVVSIDTVTYEKRGYFDPFWDNYIQNVIPRKGQGTGVLIDEKGHIVTNRHVIEKAHEIYVTFQEGKPIKARLIGEDEENDLAILKINRTGQKYLAMGDSDKIRPGDWVIVLGNPLGLGITVTAGVISAINRRLSLDKNRAFKNLIQTDAAINPGNSGGPLINTKGEIVGIATAVIQYYQGVNYQNISFAIPINLVKRVIEDLIAYGVVKKSFIGIGITDFPASDGGKGHGVFVERVYEDTPALRAGIQVKDLITHINGIKMPTVEKFSEYMKNFRVGEKISLSIIRQRKTKSVDVHLTEAPNIDEVQIRPLGIIVAKISKKRIQEFNLVTQQGVVITKVQAGSIADRAGLLSSDIIKKINDYPINSPEEFHYAMSQISRGENILLVLIRGAARKFLVINVR